MKKNVVKINENTLRKIVAESIENAVMQYYENYQSIVDRLLPISDELSKICIGRHDDSKKAYHHLLRAIELLRNSESKIEQ